MGLAASTVAVHPSTGFVWTCELDNKKQWNHAPLVTFQLNCKWICHIWVSLLFGQQTVFLFSRKSQPGVQNTGPSGSLLEKQNYKLKIGMWKLKSSPLTLKMFEFFFWMTFSFSPRHRALNVASEYAELCSDSYLVNLLSETMFNIFSDTEGLESFPITLQRWCSALMSPTVDYHLIAAQRALYASPLTILHLFCSQHCNYNNSNNHRSRPHIHFPQPFFSFNIF